ncbi:hypothetical protein L249_0687 [Ophiocordyceps polyrhachis-furcata BCC 54312]|uniref:Uncharacterized protein n=1 Tax=Ophiocordyceps polyrhachis-furcata BCC 54312 TaxID=1330021 RepID=A0A367LD25_9HYPO|nr:hypothetical protein L249_0687 [Ophiocordyceps polyrhachis-furcata BCC 54312]
MPDSQAAPERTSSFRRMLELERSYMIERLQSKKSPEGSIPNDLPASSPLSQAENIIRRASTVDGDLKPPKSSLSINTKLPIPRLPGESLGFDDATTAVATPAVGTPVAAADTADASAKDTDDRSICVSPSWESHGRRKKEKKLMEKKEREDAARTKKNRLSKQPPPPSSAEALRKAEAVPDPTVARGRVKDRSKSAAAGPVGNEAAQRKPRSRSSSFASLIRSPLSFRRASVDKASPVEPEFVGGIKLELERHMANDRRLEQQQQQQQQHRQLRDETVVHPALRQQARASGDRWPAPLQSHPPSGAATPRETGRAYPPITRQERTYRGRSMAGPPTPVTAPTTPDTGKLDQWRARVGLVPSPQPPTPPTDPDMQLMDDDSDDRDRHGFDDGFDDDDDDDIDDNDDLSLSQSRHKASSSKPSRRPKAPVGLSIFPPPARRSEEADGDGIRRKSSDAQGGYRTAPSTPPEPPRRSPKRSPRANLDNMLPPLPYQNDLISPSEVSPATLTPRTAKRMVVKPATQIVSRNGGVRRKSSKQKHRQSDDSGSDEFHSPSVPSTPATSRTESDGKKASRHLSTESSATGSSVTDGSVVLPLRQQDGGIHEIQAAADKVLASYREATSGSRRQRRESEPAGRGSLPLPVEQQRQAPQKSVRAGGAKVGRASVATTTPGSQPRRTKVRDASPATYLEEARRVPLSGVPARVAKPRLGPPASFTLPGMEDDEDESESVEVARPSLSQHEREPIAKVFVECCHCNFYHDMPSNLYEAMANPEAALSSKGTMEYGSAISMTVKCPWCRHEMSTRCCAGLAAMVFVTERLH